MHRLARGVHAISRAATSAASLLGPARTRRFGDNLLVPPVAAMSTAATSRAFGAGAARVAHRAPNPASRSRAFHRSPLHARRPPRALLGVPRFATAADGPDARASRLLAGAAADDGALDGDTADDADAIDFDDGLDDPFADLAIPDLDDGAFDAAVDALALGAPSPSSPADADPSSQFSRPGDADPWPANGDWPEFEAFLGKLMGMGYSLESPNAPPGWGDAETRESGAFSPAVSTPEWARAVAENRDAFVGGDSEDSEDPTSEDSDESAAGVRMDLADDPFEHVAHDFSSEASDEYVELSYANKKRLLLEFARDRPDVFRLLSERELYVLADHAMPRGQGNSGGRKQVNALKRLRKHLGVDDRDLRGRCAAADHDRATMGDVKLADVLRLVHVYAEDVDAADRPDRAAMQSMLRRLSKLADTPRSADLSVATEERSADEKARPRWVERRERRPPRREFEEDRYDPRRGAREGGSFARGGRGRGPASGGGGGGRRGSSLGYDGEGARGAGRRGRGGRGGGRSGDSRRFYEDDFSRDYRDDKRARFEQGFDRFGGRRDAFDEWDTRPPPRRDDARAGSGFGGFGGRGRGQGRGAGPRGRGGRGGRGGGYDGLRERDVGGFGSDLDGLDGWDAPSRVGGYGGYGGGFRGRGAREGFDGFDGFGGRGGGGGGFRGRGRSSSSSRGRGASEFRDDGRPERGSRFDRAFDSRGTSGRGRGRGRGRGSGPDQVRAWKPDLE